MFQSLPTQYSSGMVTENWVPNCTKNTTFYFPVDSATQSIDVTIQVDDQITHEISCEHNLFDSR